MTHASACERDLRPVLHERANLDPEYRACLGHTKRFLERFAADASFREALAQDPAAAATRWGLRRDPEEIRQLWDLSPGNRCSPSSSRAVARYRAFTQEKRQYVTAHRDHGTPSNPRWRAWRARQILRCESHIGPKARLLVHAPFCLELGKGCSVGCWFCAVSAARLGEQWAHNPSNRTLWRDCLEVLHELLGDGVRGGYCYWSNDPLDNPDYESFLVDFHEVLGVFPQTTTAQADRHVTRVRELIRLSEERGGVMDRFSIITLPQWNRVHEAFDASDLLFVECLPQNKEALNPDKVIAGRALERERKLVARGRATPTPQDSTSTIACVSGFYINMVDRAVQLITPCNASTRWPLGHWTLDQGTFTDAGDLRRLLQRMVDDPMPLALGGADLARFRQDLTYEKTEDGFAVSTRYRRHSVKLPSAMGDLGERLWAGRHTAAEIALTLDVPLEQTFHLLNELLFDRGLLDEEPS